MDIDNLQIEAAQKLKKFSLELKERNVNVATSAYAFVATWGKNLGFEYLKFKILKRSGFIKFLIILMKDFYSAFTTDSYVILNNFEINGKRKIIFSNASILDFNEHGLFTDRYFKINSKNYNDFIFILMYSSKEIPDNISKNVILLKRKKSFFLTGLIYFFLEFIRLNKKRNYFYNFSSAKKVSDKILLILNKIIDFKNVDKIIVPYEGIPFQQGLFLEAKKINSNIKTIGYDHSAPHAVPLNLLYRSGSPEILIVNGDSQKNYLINYLGWKKEKIKITPSLRYNKNSAEDFKNNVYFPWSIIDEKNILQSFEILLKKLEPKSLNYLNIKIHPVSVNLKHQLSLKKKLENLFVKNDDKFGNKNKNTSIFIGSTTGIIVALEKDLDVFHLCFDPLFESYSEKMWPHLKVKKINDNIFVYNLKKKNTFINFGDGDSSFNQYYDI